MGRIPELCVKGAKNQFYACAYAQKYRYITTSRNTDGWFSNRYWCCIVLNSVITIGSLDPSLTGCTSSMPQNIIIQPMTVLLLAIVQALKVWCPYLLVDHLTVLMDQYS
jgi:hypothetical protein